METFGKYMVILAWSFLLFLVGALADNIWPGKIVPEKQISLDWNVGLYGKATDQKLKELDYMFTDMGYKEFKIKQKTGDFIWKSH